MSGERPWYDRWEPDPENPGQERLWTLSGKWLRRAAKAAS